MGQKYTNVEKYSGLHLYCSTGFSLDLDKAILIFNPSYIEQDPVAFVLLMQWYLMLLQNWAFALWFFVAENFYYMKQIDNSLEHQ